MGIHNNEGKPNWGSNTTVESQVIKGQCNDISTNDCSRLHLCSVYVVGPENKLFAKGNKAVAEVHISGPVNEMILSGKASMIGARMEGVGNVIIIPECSEFGGEIIQLGAGNVFIAQADDQGKRVIQLGSIVDLSSANPDPDVPGCSCDEKEHYGRIFEQIAGVDCLKGLAKARTGYIMDSVKLDTLEVEDMYHPNRVANMTAYDGKLAAGHIVNYDGAGLASVAQAHYAQGQNFATCYPNVINDPVIEGAPYTYPPGIFMQQGSDGNLYPGALNDYFALAEGLLDLYTGPDGGPVTGIGTLSNGVLGISTAVGGFVVNAAPVNRKDYYERDALGRPIYGDRDVSLQALRDFLLKHCVRPLTCASYDELYEWAEENHCKLMEEWEEPEPVQLPIINEEECKKCIKPEDYLPNTQRPDYTTVAQLGLTPVLLAGPDQIGEVRAALDNNTPLYAQDIAYVTGIDQISANDLILSAGDYIGFNLLPGHNGVAVPCIPGTGYKVVSIISEEPIEDLVEEYPHAYVGLVSVYGVGFMNNVLIDVSNHERVRDMDLFLTEGEYVPYSEPVVAAVEGVA